MPTIGERIADIATARGFNLHGLASKADVAYNTLYSIVKRKSNRIDPEMLSKIAKALGVSPLLLTTGFSEAEWKEALHYQSIEYENDNRAAWFANMVLNHPYFFQSCEQCSAVSFRFHDNEIFMIDAEDEDSEIHVSISDLEKTIGAFHEHINSCIEALKATETPLTPSQPSQQEEPTPTQENEAQPHPDP